MATRVQPDVRLMRDQLVARRHKLEEAAAKAEAAELVHLLDEVDKALERIDNGSYGICEVCHDSIEAERLMADPLMRFCVDHLNAAQRQALQDDLDLAARIQAGLLPKKLFAFGPWTGCYHYAGAGPVSGDYCDLVVSGNDFYFIVGDVSGKGVAASMLMANLHALFRVLIHAGLPLDQLMERASRLFCESTLPMHYATLVCGKASPTGEVQICNAGHIPPRLVQGRQVRAIDDTGLPLGIFSDEKFSLSSLRLGPGDRLVLYTDGIDEAQDRDGAQFGETQLPKLLDAGGALAADALVDACVERLLQFRAGTHQTDDETLLVLQFAPSVA